MTRYVFGWSRLTTQYISRAAELIHNKMSNVDIYCVMESLLKEQDHVSSFPMPLRYVLSWDESIDVVLYRRKCLPALFPPGKSETTR